ncbi:alpha/beta hydrolase [Pseudoduganella sp. SL102]|uniref:alpha/beta hydrolase family protein n=1 Tax=Pseudoduganella sp. SL102 TaxID=2995154 RepID=UPI00248BA755|nr:alpha/beta hydrolase [Pseudoduganella sp. SL102]WBS03644.1 alpha/beta hydrolase [Pseudoduganella sp. SL102]
MTSPMTLQDYLALAGPAPDTRIAYGPAPSQFVELFLPAGDGPFPVAVLVHGGCWTVQYGGITQMRAMAGALAAQGIAVWNVEYRRHDEEGGGYPGMYQDMGRAVDLLHAQPVLDLERIVIVGHSAGGHLAQWAASRHKLPRWSPAWVADPLPIPTVISLGGLADLRLQASLIHSSCERETAQLAGVPSRERPDVFADTSPAEMLPAGIRTVLIHGELDSISPPSVAEAYAHRARAAGDPADVIVLPGASHYDEVAPSSPCWPLVERAIRDPLGLR